MSLLSLSSSTHFDTPPHTHATMEEGTWLGSFGSSQAHQLIIRHSHTREHGEGISKQAGKRQGRTTTALHTFAFPILWSWQTFHMSLPDERGGGLPIQTIKTSHVSILRWESFVSVSPPPTDMASHHMLSLPLNNFRAWEGCSFRHF